MEIVVNIVLILLIIVIAIIDWDAINNFYYLIMFYCADAAFVPNIINRAFEEEEVFNRTRLKSPLEDISNVGAKELPETALDKRNS